jgi:membrane fusion protein, multidrug efflux system
MRLEIEESQKTSVKYRKIRHFWVLLLLPMIASLGACKAEKAADEEVVRPVKVAILAPASSGRVLTYSGVVRARVESAVGFRVSGKIVERRVNIGDRLDAGQVIARLDDTDLKLAEGSAKSTLNAARTRRDVASINLERAKPLLPKGFISKAAFDIRRNEMDAASAALETAESQLSQATNAVAYTTLRADTAGVVTSVTAEPGQVVNAGQPVITLAGVGETEIAIAVPEQEAGRLSVGRSAQIKLWAAPHDSIDGRIREIAGQAEAASRTYAVRIAIGAPPPTMRLGMTATVTIRVDDENASMVVPIAAVTESQGTPVVFVVDPENKRVRKTPVTLGGTTEDGIRINGGLQAGEMVVSAGVQFLHDGMPVRLPIEHQLSRTAKAT